jgi:PKD repeat protein
MVGSLLYQTPNTSAAVRGDIPVYIFDTNNIRGPYTSQSINSVVDGMINTYARSGEVVFVPDQSVNSLRIQFQGLSYSYVVFYSRTTQSLAYVFFDQSGHVVTDSTTIYRLVLLQHLYHWIYVLRGPAPDFPERFMFQSWSPYSAQNTANTFAGYASRTQSSVNEAKRIATVAGIDQFTLNFANLLFQIYGLRVSADPKDYVMTVLDELQVSYSVYRAWKGSCSKSGETWSCDLGDSQVDQLIQSGFELKDWTQYISDLKSYAEGYFKLYRDFRTITDPVTRKSAMQADAKGLFSIALPYLEGFVVSNDATIAVASDWIFGEMPMAVLYDKESKILSKIAAGTATPRDLYDYMMYDLQLAQLAIGMLQQVKVDYQKFRLSLFGWLSDALMGGNTLDQIDNAISSWQTTLATLASWYVKFGGEANLDYQSSADRVGHLMTVTAGPNLSSGNAPLPIQFTASPSGGVQPFSYAWSFGDGVSSTSQNPSHTYQNAGTYGWTLDVYDNSGQHVQKSGTIQVGGGSGFACYPVVNPQSGGNPLTVQFSAGCSGGSVPYTYSWTLTNVIYPFTSESFQYTFGNPGTYTWTLTARDSAGHQVQKSGTIQVSSTYGSSVNLQIVGKTTDGSSLGSGGAIAVCGPNYEYFCQNPGAYYNGISYTFLTYQALYTIRVQAPDGFVFDHWEVGKKVDPCPPLGTNTVSYCQSPQGVIFTDPYSPITTVTLWRWCWYRISDGSCWEQSETLAYVWFRPLPKPTVTFQSSGVGGDASGTILTIDGRTYAYSQLPVSFTTWAQGSVHTISAAGEVSAAVGKRYVWDSWTRGLTSQSGSYTVPSSGDAVFVRYRTQWQLTLQVNPSGSGTTTPDVGSAWVYGSDVIQISAYPNQGYTFTGWTGSGSGSYTGSMNPVLVTVNAASTETANFDKVTYQTTFQTSDVPSGVTWGVTVGGTKYTSTSSILSVPDLWGSVDYAYDTEVLGASGVKYVCTSGCSGSTTNTATVTANYKTQYRLAVAVSPSSGGSTNPAAGSYWYDSGASVSVSAIPSSGFSFLGWVLDVAPAGSMLPISLTMNSPHSLAATFLGSSTIALALSAGSMVIGSSVRLSGTITPAQSAGTTSVLSYSLDGITWSNFATTQIDGSGAYSIYWNPPYPGNYQLKASWNGNTNYAGAISSAMPLSVTGTRPADILLLVTGPASVVKGDSAVFDVLVTNPGSSLSTTLYIEVIGPSGYAYFDTIQVSVAAGSAGRYQFTWQAPSATGTYQVLVGLIPPKPTSTSQTQITVT